MFRKSGSKKSANLISIWILYAPAADDLSRSPRSGPMIAVWGEEAGMDGGVMSMLLSICLNCMLGVHSQVAYRDNTSGRIKNQIRQTGILQVTHALDAKISEDTVR
jgi:hypothetical protein